MFACVCVCLTHIHIHLPTYILIYISVGVGDLFCLPLGFAAIEFHWAAPCAVINLIWVICMTFARVDSLAPPPSLLPLPLLIPLPSSPCFLVPIPVHLPTLHLSLGSFTFCIVYHIVCFSEGRLTVSERGLLLMCGA